VADFTTNLTRNLEQSQRDIPYETSKQSLLIFLCLIIVLCSFHYYIY